MSTITIVYPRGLNWFYARLATELARGLNALAVTARAVAADALDRRVGPFDETVLVVSPAECAASGVDVRNFVASLRTFERRVLVNYDSLHTPWFSRHLAIDEGLFTDLIDIGIRPQAGTRFADLPYHWIAEAAWLRSPDLPDRQWKPGRPLDWAVIGHANEARAGLVSALLRHGLPHGFVYLPRLRPYGSGNGLDEAGLRKVLERTDLYIWNSHHLHPYHEGLRAIQAVTAGAAPAKIDPFHAGRFAGIPWVYPSLRALFAARDRDGVEGLQAAARTFIEGLPPLEQSLLASLNA